MTKHTSPLVRALVRSALVAPIAVAAVVATAPGALATTADAAVFSGGYHTDCDLPYGSEGPKDGPYTCDHTATSVACASVVDSTTGGAHVDLCRANLVAGHTSGAARSLSSYYAAWECQNGAGSGTFAYQPSASSPTFVFPVTLVVLGDNLVVNGSYVQGGTGRTIVVRATFPATCVAQIDSPTGYHGSVNPA
jgi:hypothetical protein